MIKNKKRLGFSLLELLLVLGIAACLLMTSLIVYPKIANNVPRDKEGKKYIGDNKVNCDSSKYTCPMTIDESKIIQAKEN